MMLLSGPSIPPWNGAAHAGGPARVPLRLSRSAPRRPFLSALTAGILLLSGCESGEARPPWIASTLGERVYSTSCTAALEIPEDQRLYFATLEEAERVGYRVATERDCSTGDASAFGVVANGTSDSETAEVVAAGTSDSQTAEVATADSATEARTRSPSLAAGSVGPPGRPCLVIRVIDGDTIECDGGERVRLLMIDTPERSQAPFGALAAEALQSFIDEQPEVRLEMDVDPDDQYDRTLAYVWLADGRMLNEELARSGFALALVYPPNVRYDVRIRAAVEDARIARRGLWSMEAFSCEPIERRRGAC
jgi:micrococcal nuclease